MYDLRREIAFEAESWLGRKLLKSRSKVPVGSSPVLLDLGVGNNFTDGWVHVDFFVITNPVKILLGTAKKRRLPEVKKVSFGPEGTDERSIKEDPVREAESLVIEAQKAL